MFVNGEIKGYEIIDVVKGKLKEVFVFLKNLVKIIIKKG